MMINMMLIGFTIWRNATNERFYTENFPYYYKDEVLPTIATPPTIPAINNHLPSHKQVPITTLDEDMVQAMKTFIETNKVSIYIDLFILANQAGVISASQEIYEHVVNIWL